jgi:ribA/ribD-fused uncharacterized protein
MFFGTCMDGQAVYSQLLGKEGQIFHANQGQVFGEMSKKYADGDGWTEEFGKAILVKLESFERPTMEYLVPFGKVTEILKENGFEIVNTALFSDHYAAQTTFVLGGDLQAFSFLHRSFVFKRVEIVKPKEKEEVKEEEKEVEIPMAPEEEKKDEEKKDEEPKKEEEKPKKVKKVLKAKISAEPAEEPVFFFPGNTALNENRYLSNMYDAPIQIEGTTFPTVEHYFQWSKARQFGDAAAQAKILKTPSAKSVKSYGKKVTPFDAEVWSAMAEKVMRIAVKAKFMQHPELLEQLRKTGTRLIGEADPRSKHWGIGTSAETSKAKDPAKWPGKNVMGKILMDLRTELKA